MRLAILALVAALGGSGVVLRATKPVSAGELRQAVAVESARLAHLDPRHRPKVTTRGSDRLLVASPVPVGAEGALTAQGSFRVYDLEGLLKPPSIDAKGFPRPSGRLAPLRGTTVLACGPPALVCPGLDQFPPKRDVYYRLADLPSLTGNDLVRTAVRADFDPATNEPVVLLRLAARGGGLFHEMTRAEARRGATRGTPQHFAIVLDGRILNVPSIDYERYPSGIDPVSGIQITGLQDVDRARQIAAILAGGVLPVPFAVVR
jgi:hypothetical protein